MYKPKHLIVAAALLVGAIAPRPARMTPLWGPFCSSCGTSDRFHCARACVGNLARPQLVSGKLLRWA
jgi:hypothetical protein